MKKMKSFFMSVLVTSVVLTSISVQADYKRFILSTDPVEVSISNEGLKLDPKAALAIDPKTGLKDSAIAMAIGYCAFLKLTDIYNNLMEVAGSDEQTADKIMSGLGVNYWLTTAWQESHLAMKENGQREVNYPVQSGFFQIDMSPQILYQQANNQWYGWNDGAEKAHVYYSFIQYLEGGTGNGPNTENAVLCHTDQRGFTWAAVEMGYYTAYSYNANKHPYQNTYPNSNYYLPEWLINYAKNNGNKTDFPFVDGKPITVDGKTCQIPKAGAELDPCYIGTMFLGYLYNRGQNLFSKSGYAPADIFIKMINSDSTLADKAMVPYPTEMPNPNDPVVWGRRYFWQFGWVIDMLNQSYSYYTEVITKNDMLRVLGYLKGFYNKGDLDSEDPVNKAAVSKVNSLKWDQTYDSEETFNNIQAVTDAMMEASK